MQRTPDPKAAVAHAGPPAAAAAATSTPHASGPSYEPPRLEALGRWQVVTLQQSVPIGPG
ncbi:MAG: hypothetical protein ABF296_02715 [Oceanococcaceae bacterium]